jgi:hypothetical protein
MSVVSAPVGEGPWLAAEEALNGVVAYGRGAAGADRVGTGYEQ